MVNDIKGNKWHGDLPPQQLPMKKKNKEWRRAHLDWADSKTFFNFSPVRKSTMHKKINYDLFNGKLHMQDVEFVLNPEQIVEKFTPGDIQHYPIINSKLNVLRGEEAKRVFDFKVIVTNPTAISEREDEKRGLVLERLQQLVADQSQSDEEYQQNIEKMSDYFTHEWQDMREIRANSLLNHYIKEYDMPLMFNNGFMDACIIGEEIYQCDIRGGEPVIERVNPLKIRVFKSGYSNRIEDADVVILEDYWSPSKVIDTFYDVLTKEDIKHIESSPNHIGNGHINSMGERDERYGFIENYMQGEEFSPDGFYFDPFNMFSEPANSLLPFDTSGNIRVLRMYWKSRRRIKKVKRYDPETGEEIYNFFPENYVLDEAMGEEETIYYINQAWEGTKIGSDIYVNMRPRVIQYNRSSNPSRCHFGIVGSIYNINDSKPFSLVDMMKPFSYMYDAVHDRLNKLLARNWGVLAKLDLAQKPTNWDIDKWLYYAKHMGLVMVNSFAESQHGISTGKIAGQTSASSGAINADQGNAIQQYINILEFLKLEMSEVIGITRQREGQISNRETVGGVERATLQSSHITEWVFMIHDDVKKRALECFLETAKIALKGRKEKFQHIMSDGSLQVMEIDGDEFAEADYGLVVDNGNGIQELNQKLDMLAQAALQNQTLSFSTIMKLYTSCSLMEKQRLVEKDEKQIKEQQQQRQQQEMEQLQQQNEMMSQMKQAEMEQAERMNTQDNETKITVAQIAAQARIDNAVQEEPIYSEEAKARLQEQMREFDEKMKLDRDKLSLDRKKVDLDHQIKTKQLAARKVSAGKK